MKLRSGCVLDLASYFMCTKGSCFEALINYSSPVLPVGWNNDVALDVFFFSYVPASLCLWHVAE